MSQENIEIARAALNAFAELDEGLVGPEQVAQFFVQDPITTFSGFEAFLGKERTLHGADEFLKFRAAWMEPYDDFIYEPVRIIDAGANRVVATLHQRGKPHGSDLWVEMDYGLVYTVEEGLISRADFYATPQKALEAAGLSEQAMSQEGLNVETFKRAIDAYNRRDVEALLETLDPEIEWYSALMVPMGGKATVFRGYEGIRELFRDLDEVLDEWHAEYGQIRDLGDRIVAIGRVRTRGRGSGAETESPIATLCDVRDDRAFRIRTYLDPKEALEAAGLRD